MLRYIVSVFLACAVALALSGAAAQSGAKSGHPKKEGAASPSPDESAADDAAAGTKADTAKPDAPGAPSESPPPAPEASAEKGAYTVRLNDLEDRVNRLKEQIFRSKARLSLLAETILDRKIAGAQAIISFHNEMGGSFWLTKATFLLDGGAILNKVDDNGSLAERDVIELFNGPVMPGEHTLSVVLQYRGNGFGIFSYLKGYTFKVRSSRTFSVSEGKAIDVGVISFEQGGVTTPLEERPAIRFTESVGDFEAPSAGGSDPAGAAPASQPAEGAE